LTKEIISHELFIVKKMIEGDVDSFKYFFDRYYKCHQKWWKVLTNVVFMQFEK